MKSSVDFKGVCGATWEIDCEIDGHISMECTHEDGMYVTTDRIGAEEEALEACKKCPYSIAI